ncbi:hypothetical protein CFOLD11_43750 [Clostridium folliculivorans]|uniref:Uncharacterized protein n=1 Tax=Clostridium folliculivorans TaxID=2886038 RepID=A0A9W5Y6T3_9CLOT|nr:hypothetical protein [Clostridium folliculivorans]GKU27548.1 hypothetical protein CFOLD11_43750 [Clostridium folliculivorans]
MSKHKVLEKYINKELSFAFTGEYITQEELDRDFITIDYIISNTTIKSYSSIRRALHTKVITGILCGFGEKDRYVYHKKDYIYRKDFEEVLLNFYDNVIEKDKALNSLNELGIEVCKYTYWRFQRMGMIVTHPLLPKSIYFIKDKFEDCRVKLIESYHQYRSNQWVRDTIKQRCLGYELYKDRLGTPLSTFFKESNYSVIEKGSDFNFYGVHLYSMDGCLAYIDEILSNGISYIQGDHKYIRTIDDLTREELNNLYYTYEEFRQLLKKIDEQLPCKTARFSYFKRYKVNVIKISCTPIYYFFRKEEVDKLINDSKRFLSKEYVENEVRYLTDKKIDRNFFNARNIKVYIHPIICKKGLYIMRDDLPVLKELLEYENQIEAANSMYSRYMIELSTLKIQFKDIDVINKFNEYVLDRSNNSRARNTNTKALIYVRLYNLLNNNIEKNILNLPLERKIEKSKDLIEKAFKISNQCGKVMVSFINNHVIPSIDISIAKERKVHYDIDKYNDDNFTTLLVAILGILDEPNKFKKLLYNRTASSSILYVLVHFVFAWRRSDLLEKLPKPNLKLIGYDDGLKFLEDLREDNFKFEEYHGEKICKDITEYIYRMNLKSYKNDDKLEGSIPAIIYKYLGLLMCICEGNRQYVEKTVSNKYTNKKDLISPGGSSNESINKTFELFQIDIEGILGKPFGNLRGTKTFFSVLSKQFEELKMCVSKAVSDLRAHKENGKEISQTGNKYYIEKDISKLAVGIFARGTMGCVKEYILKLVESDYELLDGEKQIEIFNSLEMKNTEIEKVHKELYQRNTDLDSFFKVFQGDKKLAQEFLRELIYGKSYSKHSDCKCLLKARINANNNIIFEERNDITKLVDCQIRNDNCIGCDYLVASRLFIYEFKDLINEFFKQFEELHDISSKKLFAMVFKKKYTPLLSAFKSELGEDIFENVLDVTQYKLFNKQIAEIKLIEERAN